MDSSKSSEGGVPTSLAGADLRLEILVGSLRSSLAGLEAAAGGEGLEAEHLSGARAYALVGGSRIAEGRLVRRLGKLCFAVEGRLGAAGAPR